MKAIKSFFSVLVIAAMVSTGCSKSSSSEVTSVPEDVTQNIEEAYYITGIVSTVDGALSGATVASGSVSATTGSDGTYSLKMSTSATATVSFSKDGYVSIDATAIFASNATTGAAVTLSQELTAKAEAIAVTAGEATTLSFATTSTDSDTETEEEIVAITIAIPAAALTEDVEISATSYTPTATAEAATAIVAATTSETTETVTSSIAAVSLEPSGIEFDEAVIISIPSDYIEGAYHAKMVDGEWASQGDATYNTETSAYEIEVWGFSQHSIAVESTIDVDASSSSSVETLTVSSVDNIGNVSAKTSSISYNQYSGWEFVDDSVSTTLSNYVAGVMGSSAGKSTISQSLSVTAAGDEKVTATITQQVTTITFTLGSTSVQVSSYGDVSVSLETEQGDLRTDHNN